MGRIKNFLKKYLPMSARSMQHLLKQQQDTIFAIKKLLQAMEENRQYSLLMEGIKELKDVIETVQASVQVAAKESNLKSIEISSNQKNLEHYINSDFKSCVFYNRNNSYDRVRIGVFLEFKKSNDFEKYFLNLLHGLDYESRNTVVLMHKRMELIGNKDEDINLFTIEEQKKLRYQNDCLENIYELTNEFYFLSTDKIWGVGGGGLLPVKKYDRDVFFDGHGINHIRDKDKIICKSIIDAGAFIGDSLLILHKLTQEKVYCFEAMTENYKLLQKTILMNNIENAIAVKNALGSEKGVLKFNFRGDGSQIAKQGWTVSEEVYAITLDSYVEDNNIEVGLIKVDIEGAEQLLLKGAKKTIFQQKPILLLSIYHNPEDFYFIKPEIESWNLGYKFKIHKPINGSIISGTTLIAEV